MIKRYLTHLYNTLDSIEKASAIEIMDEMAANYFSKNFTIFNNDIVTARTLEEKILVIKNIDEVIELMKDRSDEIELAVEAAYAYIVCTGGDQNAHNI